MYMNKIGELTKQNKIKLGIVLPVVEVPPYFVLTLSDKHNQGAMLNSCTFYIQVKTYTNFLSLCAISD